MLADVIVSRARSALEAGKYVALSTETVADAQITEIEHVGAGLVRFRYSLPNDIFVPEHRIVKLEIRSADWDQ